MKLFSSKFKSRKSFSTEEAVEMIRVETNYYINTLNPEELEKLEHRLQTIKHDALPLSTTSAAFEAKLTTVVANLQLAGDDITLNFYLSHIQKLFEYEKKNRLENWCRRNPYASRFLKPMIVALIPAITLLLINLPKFYCENI